MFVFVIPSLHAVIDSSCSTLDCYLNSARQPFDCSQHRCPGNRWVEGGTLLPGETRSTELLFVEHKSSGILLLLPTHCCTLEIFLKKSRVTQLDSSEYLTFKRTADENLKINERLKVVIGISI